MATTLYGTTQDGIEIRTNEDGSLDEVCLYVGGECVMHLEQMGDEMWWMGLYAKMHTAHVNIFAKNLRSHVATNIEAWEEKPETEEIKQLEIAMNTCAHHLTVVVYRGTECPLCRCRRWIGKLHETVEQANAAIEEYAKTGRLKHETFYATQEALAQAQLEANAQQNI